MPLGPRHTLWPCGPVDDRVKKKLPLPILISARGVRSMRHDRVGYASRLRPAAFHPLCRIASSAAARPRDKGHGSSEPVHRSSFQGKLM